MGRGNKSKKFYIAEGFKFLLAIVASQATLLMSPLLVRSLGYAQYGLLELANSFSGLLAIILSLGLHQLLGVRLLKANVKIRAIVEILLLYLIVALPLCCILMLPEVAGYFAKVLLAANDPTPFRIAVWIAFATFFRHLTLSLASFTFRTNLYLTIESAIAGAYICIVFIAFKQEQLTLIWALYAQLLAMIPVLLVIANYAMKNIKSIKTVLSTKKSISEELHAQFVNLKVSIPLMGVGLFTLINSISDRFIMLALGISEESIGAYALSYRLAGVIPLLAKYMIGNIYSRELYHQCADAQKNGRDPVRAAFAFNLKVGLPLTAAIAIVVLVYSVAVLYFMDNIYNRQYSTLVGFPILLFAFMITVVDSIIGSTLIYMEKTNLIFRAILASVVVNISLNVILIPSIGPVACAVSLAISNSIRLSILWFYCNRFKLKYV
jgi:O-antigen/teichoic acid export membrane protein